MSRKDPKISEYAPSDVLHVELGNVANYSNTRVDASELDETSFVGVDNLVANKRGRVDASYPPNTARLTAYAPGDILLGNIRPYLQKVWRATSAGGCSGDVLAIRIDADARDELDSEFLYYVLSSDAFFTFNMLHARGAKMPRGDKTAILKYRIPVPPMEAQREIVRILDQFTQLEAELEAELEARTRQYEHYRDDLVLGFGAAKVPLGEIGSFMRGRRFTKADVVQDGIPSIHYGEIYTHYRVSATRAAREVRADMSGQLRFAHPNDVIFAAVGETVEDVGKALAWLGDHPVAVHDDTFAFTSEVDPKYVAYAVQTADFNAQKGNHVARGKNKRLSSAGLASIAIPVPDADEQKRVVAILDDFEALLSDISIGLPAELKARRKQYEYYRDKLLTFEEAAA